MIALFRRMWTHLIVFTRARRNRGDLPRWLVRRPQLLLATGTFEAALLACGRADSSLKSLATAKAAMLVNCEFCLDIGAELARLDGIPEEKLRALPHYRESELFTDLEKLVLTFAEEMSRTPSLVPDELRDELISRLGRAAVLELAAEVAWENQRARLNQGLGVRPAGFSDGAFCLIPEPGATG